MAEQRTEGAVTLKEAKRMLRELRGVVTVRVRGDLPTDDGTKHFWPVGGAVRVTKLEARRLLNGWSDFETRKREQGEPGALVPVYLVKHAADDFASDFLMIG